VWVTAQAVAALARKPFPLKPVPRAKKAAPPAAPTATPAPAKTAAPAPAKTAAPPRKPPRAATASSPVVLERTAHTAGYVTGLLIG
jgi:hypothetical protein